MLGLKGLISDVIFCSNSVVEVIKQVEPNSLVPPTKPRIQGEVHPMKSCDPRSEGGDNISGQCDFIWHYLFVLRRTTAAL